MKWSTVSEVIWVVAMFFLWGLPFIFTGNWYWFGMFATIGAVFGAWELARKLIAGRTLSQAFYKELRVKRPVMFWVISACMLLGWLMLLAHLIWDIPGRFF